MSKKKATPESAPPEDSPVPGEYTVVARRYRPQQFAELIGQEAVSKAITNAITSDRVAHAYLFTGARGVGKTSAARILAKALNCETGPTVNPCGVCGACRAITAGEDIDVIEIDGASNNGVDEVRTIRQNVATRPSRSRYKIYIIDEVHMLSKAAFNALLKTLEEPPPHVKFIFATTEVGKIPVTILSRCQRFDFPSITTARIFEHLKKVMAGENRQADDEALRLIARRAGGSMRDAQSLLEQMLSAGDGKLSAELVHAVLGTAAGDRVIEIASAILGKDPGKALERVAKCADDGLQLGEVLDQLIEYWRALMLLSCTEGRFDELDVPEAHVETIRRQSASQTLDTILAGLDVLATTKARLKATNHGQVLLEMAVVRLSRMEDLIPLTQIAQWISQGGGAKVIAGTSPGAVASGAEPSKKNGHLSLADSFRAGNLAAPPPPETSNELLDLTAATLNDVWAKVKSTLGVMHGAELSQASLPAIVGPKTLVLRFPARYDSAYEYCREATRATIIETNLKKLTGVPWAVRFELDAKNGSPGPTVPAVSAKDRERMALKDPLLTAILGKLEGRMLKMEEGFGVVVTEGEAEAVPSPEESP
ncbi:DNA polymerase III subunit gamma/tau [Zavarzinella formosa]|uniref:DNA polymerase III subunit gamma/tau n=1 Tax=Zavarzinella formosa TaxID=360055 RepID=UPI0002D8340C|nr:DNA polymerase III subunit gamma/tau [Zavarzinella formosa]